METSFEQPLASAHCPTCGAALDSHATMCAACGTPLAVADAAQPAPDVPVEPPQPAEPARADLLVNEPTQRLATVAPSPVPPAASQRCEWCGAMNPLESERCQTCHAMFPRPEQDEAMRRAGEARIQAAEDEIALRQRARKWYGFGKRTSGQSK